MKVLKIIAVAAIAMASFATANAQVSIRARIGTPPPPPHRVVVVQRPVRHETVVVNRGYHRGYYNRHHYNRHREVIVTHPRRY